MEYNARLKRSKRTSPRTELLRAFSKPARSNGSSGLESTTGRLVIGGPQLLHCIVRECRKEKESSWANRTGKLFSKSFSDMFVWYGRDTMSVV